MQTEHYIPRRAISLTLMGVFTVFALIGCSSIASTSTDEIADIWTNKQAPGVRNIFLLFDGTGVDAERLGAATNIWDLHSRVLPEYGSNNTISIYLPGVGTLDKPVSGLALGRGMQDRILRGYIQLAKFYRPGDRVFIFGFSRGALQARALAGLISFAGVATRSDGKPLSRADAESINEIVKKTQDDELLEYWKNWEESSAPPITSLASEQLKTLELKSATVEMLGLWDTVPGSSLKRYGACKETVGRFKKNATLFPGIDRAERYKLSSYPPIKTIVHALAADETRSKFAPLRICERSGALSGKGLIEEWFAGGHGDIGGGYAPKSGDTIQAKNISMNWMMAHLSERYTLASNEWRLSEDPSSSLHWPMSHSGSNKFSKCERRRRTAKDREHPSLLARMTSGKPARLYVWDNRTLSSKPLEVTYPPNCEDVCQKTSCSWQ